MVPIMHSNLLINKKLILLLQMFLLPNHASGHLEDYMKYNSNYIKYLYTYSHLISVQREIYN